MKKRTVRKVTQEFSPVDSCAPAFRINNFVWMEGARLEIIENYGNDHYLVRSLPNGWRLTAKREDILNKTEIVK